MSGLKTECLKFSPNVFDKSKCQNCFRTKEAHSAEALESNRASRKVSKCGYLFVAPDWDFNVTVNRTKRWQRRWFVLYDDGEFTYALDEFPDTVPQGTIDMNQVLDVSDAEGITGNDFAIAITAPDKVHFIKGTSKEESKWWFDALCRVLPRHVVRGKHKRNATFPCGKSVIPSPAVLSQEYCSEDDIRLGFLRPKFPSSSSIHYDSCDDSPSTQEENVFMSEVGSTLLEIESDAEENDATSDSTIPSYDGQENAVTMLDNLENNVDSRQQELHARRRNKRLKRENRVHRNRFNGVGKQASFRNCQNSVSPESMQDCTLGAEVLESLPVTNLESVLSSQDSSMQDSLIQEKKESGSLNRVDRLVKTNLRKSESLKNISLDSSSEVRDQISGLRRYHSFRGSSSLRRAKSSSPCNSSKNFSTKQPSGPFTRTGWLLRQTLTKEWSRHWFVLKDSSLTYFRGSEESGIMDGVLDLNQVSTIRDVDSDKHYAFILSTWDGKKHVLAAETEDLRRSWVQAIQYASNLWSLASKEVFLQNEIILPEHSFQHVEKVSSPSSLPSVDDNDKLSETSSSSDDQSEYFSLVDEDEDILYSIHQDDDIDPSVTEHQNTYENNLSSPRSDAVWKDHHSDQMECPDIQQDIKLKNQFNKLKRELTEYRNLNNLFEETVLGKSFEGLTTSNQPAGECCYCVKMSSKLIAAKEEIRQLKIELRNAHSNFDNLEVFSYKLKKDMKSKEENYNSQLNLMSAKIDDLTSKFTTAEKNYRLLKQKLKGEYKYERKRSSLKNKEGLSLSKEYESKLSELENKVANIELYFKKDFERTCNLDFAVNEQNYNSVVESGESDSYSAQINSADVSKGLLSRLQTLGTKVKHITSLVPENSVGIENSHTEKPKICIQRRDSEGSSSFDESDDSKNPSIINNVKSQNQENCGEKHFQNVSDMQIAFSEKINKLLQWLKDCFNYLCEQDNARHNVADEKTELLCSMKDVLDYLYVKTPDIIDSLDCKNVYYNLLLLIEVNKAVKKINHFEDKDRLMKFDVAQWAFRVIDKTFCSAFIKNKKLEISSMLNLFSEIPSIDDFCPIIKKILFQEQDDVNIYSSVTDRLLLLENSKILSLLDDAKKTRFLSLWDIFAKIPVQDDEEKNSKSANPLLMHVTTIILDIYHIAELLLESFESHSLYVVKIEYDIVHEWCIDTCQSLKHNLEEFLDELRKRCPVVDESTFDFLNTGDVKLREITSLVSELSFLCISSVILDATFSWFNTSKIYVPKKCTSFEKWVIILQKTLSYKTNCMVNNDYFEHPAYKCLLSSDVNQINWMDCFKICDRNTKPADYFKFQTTDLQNTQNKVMNCSCETFSEKELNQNLQDNLHAKNCPHCDELCVLLKQNEMEHQTLKQKYKLLEQRFFENQELQKQEVERKESELQSVLQHLQRLKVDYEEQKQNLKNLYEQKLQFEHNSFNEDSLQHYKAEIEDMKDMFKKGLLAIQNSHNQITSELEKRHKDEMTRLEAEKQKALELEAQATATALEAIKRFHANQLMEEISTIKEDMLNSLQIEGRQQEDFLYKYGNELEELKAEIMNITELYAAKCMENVVLEEKVNALCQQLKETHNELHRLLTKSKDIEHMTDY